MSGGHFDYKQYALEDIADKIKEEIEKNESKELDSFGYPIGRNYLKEVIDRFKMAVDCLKNTEAMVQRIDWLLSGDDSPSSFIERWDEDVKPVKFYKEK
jgi:hypothetical protein